MYYPRGPEIVPYKCTKTHISPYKVLPGRMKLFEVGETFRDLPSSILNITGTGDKSVFRPLSRPLTGDEAYKIFGQSFGFGERGSGFRQRGSEIQDFEKIRDDCLSKEVLFEDPDFPASGTSIFYSKSAPPFIEWKRPGELTDVPRLFVEGATRFDVVQGELGDCWMLAAIANLTLNEALFFRVVPDDQSFVQKYAGVFHFRFWQYGRWVDVVVDDLLPTCGGRLLYMHSKHKNEFWSALLEKAYAKLHGSYEALRGGTACEAMEDFTGGVSENYELDKAPTNMYSILLKAFQRWSLMSCSIEPDPNVQEMEMSNGLIKGHAYSITKVKMININTSRVSGQIPLLRIRNPWGNECEWKGAWSDSSPEWTLISEEEKQEVGLKFAADGEFWISYKDFMLNFSRIEICNLNPDSLDDEPTSEKSKKKWEMSMYEGSWVRNCTAGGCRNYLETFYMNPQFRIVLEDPDEDDDDDSCTMIVALMQKNRRCQRKMGQECLTIGFTIYQLKNSERLAKPLPKDYFKYNSSVARSNTYINLREVSSRFKLKPGTYCVVPSTYDPGEEGDFILRVFTEKKNVMTEYDEDIGLEKPDEEPKQDNTEIEPDSSPISPTQDNTEIEPDSSPISPSQDNTEIEPDSSPISVQEQESEEDTSQIDEIKEFFAKISGEDLEVDCYELQEILNHALQKEFTFEGFSLDVCRSMVAMMDVDRSGKLGLEEFKNLWTDIRLWKNVFKKYDIDQSGTLSTIELRAAMHSAGYRVNFHILRALVLRYGKKGKMSFDDFIACAVKLKTMIEIFQEKDHTKSGKATFTLDEWVEKTMYT